MNSCRTFFSFSLKALLGSRDFTRILKGFSPKLVHFFIKKHSKHEKKSDITKRALMKMLGNGQKKRIIVHGKDYLLMEYIGF